MPDDKRQEKTLEKGSEQKSTTYKQDSVEARSASQQAADRYKAEMDQRIADYEAGVERTSSSYGVLKELPITIFDGDSTLVTHGVQPQDTGRFPPAPPAGAPETMGGSPGDVARRGGETREVGTGRTLHQNSDGSNYTTGKDGRIEEAIDVKGNFYRYGYDSNGKLNGVTLGDQHWKSTDGKHWTNEYGQEFEGSFAVENDGGCRLQTERGITVCRLDGHVERTASDKSVVVENARGQVEKTVDATGKTRSFEYDANGKLYAVTEETGVRWSTTDRENWTGSNGQSWKGTIAVDRDGTYRYVDENVNQTIKKPDGTVTVKEANGRITDTLPDGTTKEVQKPVDREKLERLAEDLHGDEPFSTFPAFDFQKEDNRRKMHWSGELNERLDGLNEAERTALKGIYHKKYGHTIDQDYDFLEGAEKEKFKNRFTSTDPLEAKADKLRTSIDKSYESYSWYSYSHTDRTNPNDELRNTLRDMNSDEIKEMDNYYKRVYGESLHDAIKHDTRTPTREMCEIYLKGSDKRTEEDKAAIEQMKKQERLDVEGTADPKLTAEEVNEVFDKNFTRLDRDKDGFVSNHEIDRAMKDPDYKGKDAQLVAMLKKEREEIKELSNDENFDEDIGVTRKDMDKLAELARKDNKSEDEAKLVKSVDRELRDSGRKLKQAEGERGKNLWGRHGDPTDAIRPQAIQQSDVGDCWVMAPIAGMAGTPEGKEKIKNMIEDNGDGTYTVTFPGDPKHPVTVDEPTQAELGHGAAPGEDGIWVAVLEKAYAKRAEKHSEEDYTYKTDAISDGGSAEEALRLLTGNDVDHDCMSDVSKEETHEKLSAAIRDKRTVVASTPKEWGEDKGLSDGKTDKTGIPTDHQYTVTGYNPETRMVTLRNPWGGGENDGEITMSLDDFHEEFEDVDYERA